MKQADAKQQQQLQEATVAQESELPSIVLSASPRSSLQLRTPHTAPATTSTSSLPDMPLPRASSPSLPPLRSDAPPMQPGGLRSPLRATASDVPSPSAKQPYVGALHQSYSSPSNRSARQHHLASPSAALVAKQATALHSPQLASQESLQSADQPLATSTAAAQLPSNAWHLLHDSRMHQEVDDTGTDVQQALQVSQQASMSNNFPHSPVSRQQGPLGNEGRSMLTASVAAALRSSLLVHAAPQENMLSSAVFQDFTREVAARIIQHYWHEHTSRQASRQPRQESAPAELAEASLRETHAANLGHTRTSQDKGIASSAGDPPHATDTASPDVARSAIASHHQQDNDQSPSVPAESVSDLLLRYRGPSQPSQSSNAGQLAAALGEQTPGDGSVSHPLHVNTGQHAVQPSSGLTHRDLHPPEALRTSSTSLDRLKHRQAGLRKLPTAPPSGRLALQKSPGRQPPHIWHDQCRAVAPADADDSIQTKQAGSQQAQPVTTAHRLGHNSALPQHMQPQIQMSCSSNSTAQQDTSAGEQPGPSVQLLAEAAEDDEAALLQLLNPPKQNSSRLHQPSAHEHASQPHLSHRTAAAAAAGVHQAAEQWGENCSPNVSPSKEHKPKHSHLQAPAKAAMQHLGTSLPAESAPQGSAGLRMEPAAMPSHERPTRQQTHIDQLSSQKLADIFAFLDGVEAQVRRLYVQALPYVLDTLLGMALVRLSIPDSAHHAIILHHGTEALR